jgi:hypothetical protein
MAEGPQTYLMPVQYWRQNSTFPALFSTWTQMMANSKLQGLNVRLDWWKGRWSWVTWFISFRADTYILHGFRVGVGVVESCHLGNLPTAIKEVKVRLDREASGWPIHGCSQPCTPDSTQSISPYSQPYNYPDITGPHQNCHRVASWGMTAEANKCIQRTRGYIHTLHALTLPSSVQDWSLQCPSKYTPLKTTFHNAPPNWKMKTSFEVLNIICLPQEPTSVGHCHYMKWSQMVDS